MVLSGGATIDFDYLEAEGIISDYSVTKKYLNSSTNEELDLNSIDKSQASIEFTSYNASCGADVVMPRKINDININKLTIFYRKGDFYSSAFSSNNIKNIVLLDNVIEIETGSFGRIGLRNIEIPNSVTTIGYSAFSYNQLTSVVIPDSVTTIGALAFESNQLTSVVIPDSVTTIEQYAFRNNQLTSVTIGSGIQYIAQAAFYKESSSNPNLSSITINRSCSDIKNIPGSSTDSTKYYPWLSDIIPYTASGVTIYGTGGDVCDSY